MSDHLRDPLSDKEPEPRGEVEKTLAAILARVEALSSVPQEMEKLSAKVRKLEAGESPDEPERAARTSLPAVEKVVEPPTEVIVPPVAGLDARTAAAEAAKAEAERAHQMAEAAARRAEEALLAAEEAAAELAAAEERLAGVKDVARDKAEKRDKARGNMEQCEAQLDDCRDRLTTLRDELMQAENLLENMRSIAGADSMISETDKLVEEKKAVIAKGEEKEVKAQTRLERARNTYNQADSKLATAEKEVTVLANEVKRLKGDPIPSPPAPAPEAAPDAVDDPVPDNQAVSDEPVASDEPIQDVEDEDEIDRRARSERERLEQELSGGAPVSAPAIEVDEDARRLAEITRAEISGEDLDADLTYPEVETPTIAPRPPSPPSTAEPSSRSMPWESPQEGAIAPIEEMERSPEPLIEVAHDHVPAYAGIEEEKRMTPPVSGPPAERTQSRLPEPLDVLYAIAIPPSDDVMEPTQAPARQVVQATRAAAEESRAHARRGRGQKPRFEELPFESLVARKPLIISFFSPAGGVGKSSASLNAAALIAAIGARQAANAARQGAPMRVPRVLAFDGDIVAGSLALLLTGEVKPNMHNLQLYLDDRAGALGIDPSASPAEWNERYRERWPRAFELGEAPAGEEPMKKFVHWPERLDNLNLLAAPDDPSKYHDFSAWEYEELLDICSQFYDVIVIDCGTEQVMESNQTWLRHSHSVFMMVTPALDRIWNSSKAMGYIARRRRDPLDRSDDPRMLEPLVTRERVSVVMTSADMETGLNLTGEELIGEFFPYIDEKQRFYVPDVRDDLMKANNSHDFLVLNDARFAKSIMAMVKHSFDRYSFATRGGLSSGRR